jgi:hypothetical protein
MTIKILEDKIEFDNFSLTLSNRGLSVNEKNSSSILAELKAASILQSTYSFQGSQFGYISGGYSIPSTFGGPSPSGLGLEETQQILKFPLVVAGGLLSQVSNLTDQQGHGLTGNKSAISGYTCGSLYNTFSWPTAPSSPAKPIEYTSVRSGKSRLSFSSDYNTTEGGTFDDGAFDYAAGHSSSTHGYVSGGRVSYAIPGNPVFTVSGTTSIRKFSFAADSNGTIVGNLQGVDLGERMFAAGCSSSTDGFSVTRNNNNKFPYASESSVSFAPNVLPGTYDLSAALSSTTHGYIAGGSLGVPVSFGATGIGGNLNTGGTPGTINPYGPDDPVRDIRKFSFSSHSTVTLIGNLIYRKGSCTGISSIAHGIVVGGRSNPTGYAGQQLIERFPFAADVNGIEVGDMTRSKNGSAGFQY